MIEPTSVFLSITKTPKPTVTVKPTLTIAPTKFMIPTLSYTLNDMKEWTKNNSKNFDIYNDSIEIIYSAFLKVSEDNSFRNSEEFSKMITESLSEMVRTSKDMESSKCPEPMLNGHIKTLYSETIKLQSSFIMFLEELDNTLLAKSIDNLLLIAPSLDYITNSMSIYK